MKKLGELAPKVGDKVRFAQSAGYPYQGIVGTIIASDPNDKNQTYLMGWKEGETHPDGIRGKTPVEPSSKCQLIESFESYIFSGCVSNSWEVEETASTQLGGASQPKGGMHCSGKYCNVFHDYAVSNQPDGKFLCYSCRQRPACMR